MAAYRLHKKVYVSIQIAFVCTLYIRLDNCDDCTESRSRAVALNIAPSTMHSLGCLNRALFFREKIVHCVSRGSPSHQGRLKEISLSAQPYTSSLSNIYSAIRLSVVYIQSCPAFYLSNLARQVRPRKEVNGPRSP